MHIVLTGMFFLSILAWFVLRVSLYVFEPIPGFNPIRLIQAAVGHCLNLLPPSILPPSLFYFSVHGSLHTIFLYLLVQKNIQHFWDFLNLHSASIKYKLSKELHMQVRSNQ